MTLDELKEKVRQYQYIEDTNIIDVVLASIIATRLKLGNPVWLIIIGASSGGKSQILRPLALTDAKFLHRVDDLTENTFLSGGSVEGGGDASLMARVGSLGMLVISDMTVIFSKSPETKATILSQFRMIYDGEMNKHVGNRKEPLHWHGDVGVIAGSTPSIYRHFQEVADMGERFIHYRFRDYDAKKATHLALTRKIYGKELDMVLATFYQQYVEEIVVNAKEVTVSQETMNRIVDVAAFAEKIRTPVHTDFKGVVTNVPITAMPMRVALQLMTLARALLTMRGRELDENDHGILDWCAYSLANEEKRDCLRVLASIGFGMSVSTQTMADEIGLDTTVTRNILQNLAAVGVLIRIGDGGNLVWSMADEEEWKTIRRIEKIDEIVVMASRSVSDEEWGAQDE